MSTGPGGLMSTGPGGLMSTGPRQVLMQHAYLCQELCLRYNWVVIDTVEYGQHPV